MTLDQMFGKIIERRKFEEDGGRELEVELAVESVAQLRQGLQIRLTPAVPYAVPIRNVTSLARKPRHNPRR